MILFLADNEYLYKKVKEIVDQYPICCSFRGHKNNNFELIPIDMSLEENWNYDLIFSIHSKQLLPKELVKKVVCINLHPGFNPYNRGWYPHIFSIINGKPAGATLHIIDEHIDHGPIIDQIEVPIEDWDTSCELIKKIYDAEIKLFEKNFFNIVNGYFVSRPMDKEGNLNTKKDFMDLCKLNLDEKITIRECINILKALTHDNYKNAYFVNNGKRVFVSIKMMPENQ